MGSSIKISEIVPTVDNFDENHPLYNKKVVFTGSLKIDDEKSLHRKDAMQAVVNLGGKLSSTVSKNTNYLVTGEFELATLKMGETVSSKFAKAMDLIDQGYDIKIIGAKEFMKLISYESSTV